MSCMMSWSVRCIITVFVCASAAISDRIYCISHSTSMLQLLQVSRGAIFYVNDLWRCGTCYFERGGTGAAVPLYLAAGASIMDF